jgi:hypothetical protein
LVQCANKDLRIPSSSTITRRILEDRLAVEERIKELLPENPVKIAIALDCWSAPRREGYIAIKAYWITERWGLKEALIGFEAVHGKHTGEALGGVVLKRLELFKIHTRISAITTDNASNNTTMTESLNASIGWLNKKIGLARTAPIVQSPCIAHVIQLAVERLTVKMHITAKNSEVVKNWVEDEEIELLDDLQINEKTIGRVSTFYGRNLW